MPLGTLGTVYCDATKLVETIDSKYRANYSEEVKSDRETRLSGLNGVQKILENLLLDSTTVVQEER